MKILHQRTGQMLTLFSFIVIGVILGSILSALYPAWTIWQNDTFRQGMGFDIYYAQAFYYIMTPVFWLAVLGALGLSAVGLAGTPFVLCLRGAALGAILELLYAGYGWKGIVTALLFIMPYAFAATMIMVLGAREAFRLSMQITGLVCEKTSESGISVKLYSIRFLILCIALVILGWIQCIWLKYGMMVLPDLYLI